MEEKPKMTELGMALEIEALRTENKRLRKALEKIKEPAGAYSRDQIKYLKNVIESQVDIASKALEEKP